LFLMHPKDKFIAGLSCFLLVHIAYSIGFFQAFQQMSWWILAGFIATGILTFLLLLPNLGSMALPVGAYIIVIAMMASTAAGFWLTYHNTPALLALTGALMFILSDLVLAIDRFRSSSHFSQ
ncbi:lysoplasmalogenase, partial [Vibrio anguillarum]